MSELLFEDPDVWGRSTLITLFECDPEKISNRELISDFAYALCAEIDMKMFGKPIIPPKFGYGDKSGYSLVQLIETSNITAHFAEDINAVYIDIFSCKEYDPGKATSFCANFFDAKDSHCVVADRFKTA